MPDQVAPDMPDTSATTHRSGADGKWQSKQPGTCQKCAYYGIPAFDAKCPRCGDPMAATSGGQQVDPRSTNMTVATQAQAPQSGTITSSFESVECSFCSLKSSVDEDYCPRCNEPLGEEDGPLTDDDLYSKPEQEQNPAQPGGPQPGHDHPMNCPGCGSTTVGEETNCLECGYSFATESEIDWSDKVTSEEVADVNLYVSFAQFLDEDGLKALSNYLVWGLSEDEELLEMSPEDLAKKPPKWLNRPDQQKHWSDTVMKHGCTNYPTAVRIVQNSLKKAQKLAGKASQVR